MSYYLVITRKDLVFCLFVCLFGVYRPTRKFFTQMDTSHRRWCAANFDLCSALMAIEQWGFFNVPHLLRHGPALYNGHLRGPVTLTPVAERFAVELSLPVFTTCLSRQGIETRSPACEANALPLRHRGGHNAIVYY